MLLLLPEELIIEVLSHLSLQDIKNILRVCKTLKRLGEDDAIWIGFYEHRYFSRYVNPITYELCEEKTWRYLYHNKARLENRIWEAGDSPKKNHILVQNRALEVTCMKYDSKYVVTGGGFADVWDFDPQTLLAPKTVQVYDLKTGRKVRTLPGHADSITCVQFHGTTVVSGAKDHMIKIWRPLGHKWSKKIPFEEKTLFGHTKSVCCLDWRETDALLVSGGKDKKINLWDITSEMNVDCIYAPAIPYCIQLYNNHIVAGGKDRKIRIWDCDTAQQIQVMKGHKGWVSCLQMTNNLIVSGGGDGTIRIFDMRTGQNTRTIKTETSIFSVGWITCLQWDENKIVTGSADKYIRIHDIISGKCINTLKGHRDIVTGVQYDSQKLLSSSLDRTVRSWDFSASNNAQNPPEQEGGRCNIM